MTSETPPTPASAHVTIRPCRQDELPSLEWGGAFRRDRAIIEHVFRRAADGTALMLVAVAEGEEEPVGQIWADLARKPEVAVLWALRVRPAWRAAGIGTRLIEAAEAGARDAGATWTELQVLPTNHAAARLYARLGYRLVGVEPVMDAVTGAPIPGTQLAIMRKRCSRGPEP